MGFRTVMLRSGSALLCISKLTSLHNSVKYFKHETIRINDKRKIKEKNNKNIMKGVCPDANE